MKRAALLLTICLSGWAALAASPYDGDAVHKSPTATQTMLGPLAVGTIVAPSDAGIKIEGSARVTFTFGSSTGGFYIEPNATGAAINFRQSGTVAGSNFNWYGGNAGATSGGGFQLTGGNAGPGGSGGNVALYGGNGIDGGTRGTIVIGTSQTRSTSIGMTGGALNLKFADGTFLMDGNADGGPQFTGPIKVATIIFSDGTTQTRGIPVCTVQGQSLYWEGDAGAFRCNP
jgi:hypothetical protein